MPAAPMVRMLQERARMLASAREFFAARGVMEVDTPLLGNGLVVEAHIDPIPCQVATGNAGVQQRHLLTSPEGPMKRLLALGSGPIYQFAHAFRDGEVGRRHAPEFTMLEWYRPGFDHHQLMHEVAALVAELVPQFAAESFTQRTYQEVFVSTCGVDPFATSLVELGSTCERLGIATPPNFEHGSIDDALDLLLVSHIEPTLGAPTPTFVHEYPQSQAALAHLGEGSNGHPVAQRFELYIDGIELCNGYHELADAHEQRRRFEQANLARQASGRYALPIDEELIAALAQGFPACAGVALGFDRLLMLATGAQHIDHVR
jgi:elongation factor P--(R)-beta-lysine ligase